MSKEQELAERMERLGIKEEDLVEKFILGSGSGGQKINKTSSCVYLKHLPTGTEVKCQKDRSRELNRLNARRELCEKLEEILFQEKSKKRQAIEKIRRMILATGAEGYIACASAVRDMAQTTMLLQVKAPTLVLVGRQDPACTVEQATVIHRMIDKSELVVLEDAAHLSNVEQPQTFNAAVRAFIDRVEAALA